MFITGRGISTGHCRSVTALAVTGRGVSRACPCAGAGGVGIVSVVEDLESCRQGETTGGRLVQQWFCHCRGCVVVMSTSQQRIYDIPVITCSKDQQLLKHIEILW
jgi:hypothetical protein